MARMDLEGDNRRPDGIEAQFGQRLWERLGDNNLGNLKGPGASYSLKQTIIFERPLRPVIDRIQVRNSCKSVVVNE